MTKISVIIPVFNAEKYLKKCLGSVLTQTMADIEVICINDGSTDNSLKLLEESAAKDPRIKVLNQANCGQSVARNKGLDIACGDYIYFVDADDYIHQQTFEVLHNVAEKTQCLMVVTEHINYFSKQVGKVPNYSIADLKYSVQKKPLKHLLNNIWSSSVIWNKLYKREVLNGWRFIEGIYFEDWPFITCLTSTLERYASVPYPLYFYNDNDYSTVRSTFTLKKLDDYLVGIRFTHQYFQTKDKLHFTKEVRQKRIAASIKMVINKVKREPVNHVELVARLTKNLLQLRREKVFFFRDLPFKVVFRFLKMCYRGY